MAVHHYCKQIDVALTDRIYYCILGCFCDKWERRDVVEFLLEYLPEWWTEREVRAKIKQDKKIFEPVLRLIAWELGWQIKTRSITLPPIHYKKKYDPNSKKTRIIGVQSIKQQIYDYLAVKSALQVWDKRIGCYQCASIPTKGQQFGKKQIQKWLREEPREYNSYATKGDIKKCYPSINRDLLKARLKKDIDNPDLLYLIFTLMDTFEQGLSIGSYLSQYLCNYYISFAYDYLQSSLYHFHTHALFYMDDFLILGRSKEQVVYAMEAMVEFFKQQLQLTVKPNWEVFPTDWIDQSGKRHGKPIDMMGFVMYRTHTKIRSNIFLKGRRTYKRAEVYSETYPHPRMKQELAYKCISYFGWFKHSNSKWFILKNNLKKKVGLAKAAVAYYNKKKGDSMLKHNIESPIFFYLFS